MFVHYPFFTQNHPPFYTIKADQLYLYLLCVCLSIQIGNISTFRPYKPYIFGKLMTRPNQITSSSVIHQLPVSPSLVVTNNDDIVQNSIQFLVQNSYSLLLSSFTNNYIVGSWTFNPPKCKPPFLSSICVSTLLAPFLSGQ